VAIRNNDGEEANMVPRGMRGRMMKLRRVEDDGSVTERGIEAMDLTNGDITFRVDARGPGAR
jgi:hypothetical protein